MAITDHVGLGNVEYVLKTLITDCAQATRRWDILVLPGVEVTHVPKEDIDLVARTAKEMGAKMVAVHGETVVEPVEPGTNEAAIRSSFVDILAHPGLISLEEARLAAERGVYLEVSARRSHAYANGHVAKMAKQAGASLVLDSDAHEPEDLLTPEFRLRVAKGAGLDEDEVHAILETNPRNLAGEVGFRAGSRPRGRLTGLCVPPSPTIYRSGIPWSRLPASPACRS